jgi:hypothetical protein
MTNKYTIISQIITLLHFSTLSCHRQGAHSTLPSYTNTQVHTRPARPQHQYTYYVYSNHTDGPH